MSLRQKEFTVLALLSLLVFACFRNSDLDLWAARLFYHPENANDPWFEQDKPLWIFFYYAAPWLTGILLLGSLAILGLARSIVKLQVFRIYAVYVFLVIALGSGLLVNGIFKPYWGRPRPREVIELGGKHEYRSFYSPDVGAPGKSFPCGHCSVGFSYGLLWWILRRKKPVLAVFTLAGSLGLGALMGIGRIAAGGHFFSDVVWAGLMVYWVCFVTYHFLLNVPAHEAHSLNSSGGLFKLEHFLQKSKSATNFLYTGLAVATVLILLVASPFHKEIELKSPAGTEAIDNLVLRIDHTHIDLKLDENLSTAFVISGFAKGFGFPGNKIVSTCDLVEAKSFTCKLHRNGFFSDYESIVELKINPQLLQKFHLIARKGEIFHDEKSPLPANYTITIQ